MSIENPSFENEPKPKKTDWSFLDETFERIEQERRSKMTPEELAADDKQKEEDDKLHKELDVWYERSKIKTWTMNTKN